MVCVFSCDSRRELHHLSSMPPSSCDVTSLEGLPKCIKQGTTIFDIVIIECHYTNHCMSVRYVEHPFLLLKHTFVEQTFMCVICISITLDGDTNAVLQSRLLTSFLT